MTAFTSVQDGDWNDPDTWDVGGGDFPTSLTAVDTATISHTVTYNIDNSGTNRMGKITLTSGGILQHSTDASTYLHIRGDGTNIIQSTAGKWHIASSGSPLSSSFTVTIEVDQASDGTGILYSSSNDGDIQWFGTDRGLESRVVPGAGFPLHILGAQGLRGKGWSERVGGRG